MSSFEFRLPDIGEGVAEGEIVEWLVKQGDVVNEDDPMVEVMTDKATVTIGAPRSGTIDDIRFAPGATAQVGDVIVVIATQGGATAKAAPAKAEAQPATEKKGEPAATAVGDIKEGLPGSTFFGGAKAAPKAKTAKANGSSAYFADKPLATPATRKVARELNVDLRRVPPTGPNGRVTKDDVRNFNAGGKTSVQGNVPKAAPTSIPQTDLEVRKPFVGIRRKIAQRMQTTKNTAAHFTFVEECDVTNLIALRQRLKAAATEEGVKLSYLPFIVKAVVKALQNHEVLNSALDEETNELVYRKYINMGIAAATPNGLMVPVVKQADRLSIIEVAKEIERLGEGARAGTLSADELTGSTFTITSLGKQGGLFATPILNHPEVGILGVHRIKERPVVKNGEIVIGNVMLLSLSFDHRIVDGHVGAAFAYDIINILENPERLFLQMS